MCLHSVGYLSGRFNGSNIFSSSSGRGMPREAMKFAASSSSELSSSKSFRLPKALSNASMEALSRFMSMTSMLLKHCQMRAFHHLALPKGWVHSGGGVFISACRSRFQSRNALTKSSSESHCEKDALVTERHGRNRRIRQWARSDPKRKWRRG